MRKVGWYTVRVLIKATGRGQPTALPLFEDRLVLVRAKNHDEAERKASTIVRKTEKPYKNPFGNVVRWKLAKVYESVELFDENIVDGTEVYWRFIYAKDPVKRLKREITMNGIFRENYRP